MENSVSMLPEFLSQSIRIFGVKSPQGSPRSRAFSPFVLVRASESFDMNPH